MAIKGTYGDLISVVCQDKTLQHINQLRNSSIDTYYGVITDVDYSDSDWREDVKHRFTEIMIADDYRDNRSYVMTLILLDGEPIMFFATGGRKEHDHLKRKILSKEGYDRLCSYVSSLWLDPHGGEVLEDDELVDPDDFVPDFGYSDSSPWSWLPKETRPIAYWERVKIYYQDEMVDGLDCLMWGFQYYADEDREVVLDNFLGRMDKMAREYGNAMTDYEVLETIEVQWDDE